ncbi:hypothetical protein [Lichenifustis flavocetrariae]|nr:hypothetical protein [Lichenifustis flavocetrariae]
MPYDVDPELWRFIVLDVAFIVLGLALFGITAAYAAACERM